MPGNLSQCACMRMMTMAGAVLASFECVCSVLCEEFVQWSLHARWAGGLAETIAKLADVWGLLRWPKKRITDKLWLCF
jgi:hypothetical protein